MILATTLACGISCSNTPEPATPAPPPQATPTPVPEQAPPPPSDPAPSPLPAAAVASTAPAPPPIQPDVQFSANNGANQETLKQAYAEVLAILNDPAFRQQLTDLGNHPLATTADRACETTTTLAVLDSLRGLPSTFKVETKSTGATGATNVCGPSRIKASWLERWNQVQPDGKPGVINTLAHEMAHVLTTPNTSCSNHPVEAYTDGGHKQCGNGKTCSDAFLVSYTWGDIVECAYRVKKGTVTSFKSCVLSTVNDAPLDRSSMSFRIPEQSKCADTPAEAWKWR